MQLIRHQHREYLAQALACRIARGLWQAIDRRGRAYLMLSGGSTPAPMLRALGQQPLPWTQVEVTLADERWVNEQHAESNARMLRETLFAGAAQEAHWRSLYHGAASVEAEVAALNQMDWTQQAPDVLVLGMGGDGHTASLFPDLPDLQQWLSPQAPEPLLAVHTQASPLARVSFSGRILHSADSILLHLHGEDKMQVLEQAQAQRESHELGEALPIASFLDQAEIWWAP